MLGYRMFSHALRMVFTNLPDALRLSVALVVAGQLALWLLVYRHEPALTPAGPEDIGPAAGVGMQAIAGFLVNGLLGAWVAVAWHRFVLLQEYPQAVLPPWSASRTLSYFGRLLLVSLIVGLAGGLGAAVLILPLTAALGSVGVGVGGAVVGTGVIWLSLRLGLVMPSAAIDQPMGLRQSWAATAPVSRDLVGLSVIGLAGLAATALLAMPGPLGAILGAVASWITLMVGASVLTTVYGVAVEGRELR